MSGPVGRHGAGTSPADAAGVSWGRDRRGRPVAMLGATPLLPTPWELFILAVTLLSVVNLVIYLAPILSIGVRTIVFVVDVLLTIPLLMDFGFRFRLAPDRRAYLGPGRGWLDLVGSLPIPLFRLLRLVRVRNIGGHLGRRGLRGTIVALLREPAAGALLGVILLTILVMEIGSAAMLVIEAPAAGAKITTPSDALWFSYETITTVGYGDVYPVTNLGRGVGAVVLTLGIALFGTFTGYLANAFLSRRTEGPQGVGSVDGTGGATPSTEVDVAASPGITAPSPGVAVPSTEADVAADLVHAALRTASASGADAAHPSAGTAQTEIGELRDEIAELRRIVERLADRAR